MNMKSVLKDLLDLTKPRLTLLVVITSLIGFVLAPAGFDWVNATVSIFAITCLVAGACALNCYIEREVDKTMDRTKDRPLPSGRLSAEAALAFSMTLLCGSVFILYKYVNPLTTLLGVVAAVLYVYAYTPLKQKSIIALFVGAVPGAMPPVMGWTAVAGEITVLPVALFLIIFVWQIPHFLAISIFRKEDYEKANIKIVPTKSGVNKTVTYILLGSLALVVVSLIPSTLDSYGMAYSSLALALGGLMLVVSLSGYKNLEGEKNKLWARSYFYATLFYLPVIFIGLTIF